MAGNGAISDKTPVRMPLALWVGMAVTIATCVGGLYGMRDQVMRDIQAMIRAEISAERAHRLEQTISRVEFLEWRRQEQSRQDQRHFQILQAINNLKAEMERRR